MCLLLHHVTSITYDYLKFVSVISCVSHFKVDNMIEPTRIEPFVIKFQLDSTFRTDWGVENCYIRLLVYINEDSSGIIRKGVPSMRQQWCFFFWGGGVRCNIFHERVKKLSLIFNVAVKYIPIKFKNYANFK